MAPRFHLGLLITSTALLMLPLQALAGELASVVAQAGRASEQAHYEGTVEAVRQTVIAAQVAGPIVALNVKAGDVLRKGQVILSIDARASRQNATAADASAAAARAALDAAARDYERQKQLFAKQYISQAALERSESQFKTTSAQLGAQIAAARAAGIESGFYVIKAPYDGAVSELAAMVGDMATPGKPLITMYDPAHLRVAAFIPQSAMARVNAGSPARIALAGRAAQEAAIVSSSIRVLPAADPGTRSVQVYIDLPASAGNVNPGTSATVRLDQQRAGGQGIFVPQTAIVRRAEMTGVYVLDASGKPLLRQVRLGTASGDMVEVLAGVAPGERIAAHGLLAAGSRR